MRLAAIGDFSEPLLAIEAEQLTGVLELSAQGEVTRVFVDEGAVVFAEAAARGERIGSIFVRAGLLTEEQLVEVLRRMTDGIFDDEDARFGDIVVEYGFLTAPQLAQVLTEQVRQRILAALQRGQGRWAFQAGAKQLESIGSYPVKVLPLFHEAMRRAGERRIEQVLHLEEERYPELLHPARAALDFELTPDELDAASQCRGVDSLLSLVSRAWSLDFPALLAALVLGKAVTLHPHPVRAAAVRSRPLPAGNLRPSADRVVVAKPVALPSDRPPAARLSERAFAKVEAMIEDSLRRPSSDRTRRISRSMAAVVPPPTAESRERAEIAMRQLRADGARRASSRPPGAPTPEPVDPGVQRLLAETTFREGRGHMRAGRRLDAHYAFARAAKLQPKEREYELAEAWSKLAAGETQDTPRARGVVRSLATLVARCHPSSGFAYYVLGDLALRDGREDAAIKLFTQAFELEEDLVDVAREACRDAFEAKRGEDASSAPESPPEDDVWEEVSIDELIPELLREPRS